MRILITGGAGFIGSNLVDYHLKKLDEVIVVDDLSTGKVRNIAAFIKHPNFKFYQHNLLTWDGLSDVLNSVDRVYHLAAIVGLFKVINNPVKTLKVNINSTLRLYDLIHAQSLRPLVIIASSSEVYGNQTGKLHEDSPLIIANSLKNQASYSISKLCEESIALSYYDSWKLPCIVLRIFNTIGFNQSGQYGMVVPRFIKQAINNADITIFGDGKQKRAFCNVKDLVNLMDLIAQLPEAVGQIINIGNDEMISVNALAKLIKKISKSESTFTYTPLKEAYVDKDVFIKERKPDISKLLNYTHYKYQYTMEKTLKELIAFYKKQQK